MRVDAQRVALESFPLKAEKNNMVEKQAENSKMGLLPERKEAVDETKLAQVVEELNHFFSYYHLQFRVHEGSGRWQVKMIDEDTQEVIRQWPPDTILEISARFKEMLEKDLGILLDARV